jgi:small subunit ribosomal protein S16
MLVIRMQRSGRKGHAMFRVVVQDSRRTPTSGKLVARLGSYDPHAKTVIIDSEKTQFYLDHGAQPSERLARLLAGEGVKLPKWVITPEQKQRTVRNADKRRSTRPEAPVEEAPAEPETPAVAEAAAEPETPVETTEVPAEPEASEAEAPASESAEKPTEEEAPAEEATEEPAEAAAEEAKEAPAEEAESTSEPVEAPEEKAPADPEATETLADESDASDKSE